MSEPVIFYVEETGEEVSFELIDSFDQDGQRYVLVADANDEATILKEVSMDDEITYELIEDDYEFQQIAILFLESDADYDLEF